MERNFILYYFLVFVLRFVAFNGIKIGVDQVVTWKVIINQCYQANALVGRRIAILGRAL